MMKLFRIALLPLTASTGFVITPGPKCFISAPVPVRGVSRFSHVEGPDFFDNSSTLDEIEEMGGDPFFFSNDDDDPILNEDNAEHGGLSSLSINSSFGVNMPVEVQDEKRSATDGLGPTPRSKTIEVDDDWNGWDGTVDEDAHLGLD